MGSSEMRRRLEALELLLQPVREVLKGIEAQAKQDFGESGAKLILEDVERMRSNLDADQEDLSTECYRTAIEEENFYLERRMERGEVGHG